MPYNSNKNSRRGKSSISKTGGSSPGQGTGPKPRLTHFLCIPLVTSSSRPQLDVALSKLKEAILSHGALDGSVADGDGNVDAEAVDAIDETRGDAPSRRSISLPHGKRASTPMVEAMLQAVRPAGTLHLTLGVMSLTTPERVAEAVSVLKSLDLRELLREAAVEATAEKERALPAKGVEDASGASKIPLSAANTLRLGEETDAENVPARTSAHGSSSTSPPPSLTLALSSLQPMHSPSSTTVLYADPRDETERLLPFCRAIISRFSPTSSNPLIVPDDRPLKLHATVLNTVYAPSFPVSSSSTPGHRAQGRRGKPLRIDAKPLLQEFDDFRWAEPIRVQKLAICKMGAQKVRDERGVVIEEEYEEVASVALPYESG